MRISDWSSDVCSSDLRAIHIVQMGASAGFRHGKLSRPVRFSRKGRMVDTKAAGSGVAGKVFRGSAACQRTVCFPGRLSPQGCRSEEHTSEPPVTYAHLVCRLLLEKKKKLR